MSDVDFFRTKMGHIFYEGTLPQLVKEVGRLADSVTELNESLRRHAEGSVQSTKTDAGRHKDSKRKKGP